MKACRHEQCMEGATRDEWWPLGDWEAGKGGRCTLSCIPFVFIEFVPERLILLLSDLLKVLPRWRLVVKNPPANAGELRDMGSIPGS